MGLGAPPDVYDRYARDIAAEYSHMDPLDYRTGREAVLEGFLGRERLFFTTEGRDRFEVQARNNLRREIETLTS